MWVYACLCLCMCVSVVCVSVVCGLRQLYLKTLYHKDLSVAVGMLLPSHTLTLQRLFLQSLQHDYHLQSNLLIQL